MNWLRKHKNAIMIAVIVGFVISTFIGFGRYLAGGNLSSETVAEVNGENIPYKEFVSLYDRVVNNRRDKGEDLNQDALNQIKQQVIQSLVQETVFYQEAKRYGIEVSDNELAQSLTAIPAFQKDGKFNVQAYAQALRFVLKSTPEEFEESQRKQIAISRLRAFILQGIKITDQELDRDFLLDKKLHPETAKKNKPGDEGKEKAEFREKLRQEQMAQILNQWYQQLGTNLKVKLHLEEIEKRAGG